MLFFCFSNFILAQGLRAELTFNEEYQQFSNGLICVDEYAYFLKEEKEISSFFNKSSIVKVDTTANIVWELEINPFSSEKTVLQNITSDTLGNIYVSGFSLTNCDVFSNVKSFVIKVNSGGNINWIKSWQDINSNTHSLSGLSISNQKVYVNHNSVLESKIYTLNQSNGTLIDSLTISTSDISSILEIQNNIISSQLNRLLYFNSFGQVLNEIIYSSNIQNIAQKADTIYVLTQDSIFSYNLNLSGILNAQLTGFSNLSNLKINDNTISVVNHSSTAQTILELNHTFQILTTTEVPVSLKETDPKDFNPIHFCSSTNFDLTQFQSIRFLDYSLNSTSNNVSSVNDIGIVDIDFTDIITSVVSSQFNVYSYEVYADVLLKNYGNNTLNSCRINNVHNTAISCGHVGYSEFFDNLNLQSGDSVWLSIGLIQFNSETVLGNPILKEICVYTSNPNQTTDLLVINDAFCKEALLGYLSLENNPNLAEKKLIKIVDLLGREVDSDTNQILIYVYSDGTIEKRMQVEH